MNYRDWLKKKYRIGTVAAPVADSASSENLASHDRRFHRDGFDPQRDTCKFREELAEGDKVDELNVAGGRGRYQGNTPIRRDMSEYSPYVKYSSDEPMIFDVFKTLFKTKGWATGFVAERGQKPSETDATFPAILELKNPLNLMEGYEIDASSEDVGDIDESRLLEHKVNAFCDLMEKAGVEIDRDLIKSNVRMSEFPRMEDLIDSVGRKKFEEAAKKLGYDGYVGDYYLGGETDTRWVTAFDKESVKEVSRQNPESKDGAGRGGSISSMFDVPNEIPSEDEIKSGNAVFMGTPLVYVEDLQEEANHTHDDRIEIGPRFFDMKDGKDVLVHEKCHELSDRWLEAWGRNEVDGKPFIKHKKFTPSMLGYDPKDPDNEFIEGIDGGVGTNALGEAVTNCLVWYFMYPDHLKERSEAFNGDLSAYEAIESFLKKMASRAD